MAISLIVWLLVRNRPEEMGLRPYGEGQIATKRKKDHSDHWEGYTMAELKDADEVLVSSTSKFCLAAKTLDGVAIGGKDRETYRRLRAYMVDEFYAYIEAHK